MPSVPGRRPPLLLELDLTDAPVEPDGDDPIARLRNRGRAQLRPTLKALHEAAADRHVVGLIAKVGGQLPWAVMQELRGGVRAFAGHGKPAVAWAETFAGTGTAGYVLATAFDEIWLQPGGELGLLGVGIEATFVRGALDRLGVEPQFEQRHEYKNAADRILRTGFTDAHRESLDRIAGSLFDEAVAAVSRGRSMTTDQIRELVETGPRSATEAHSAGLVDHVGYRDEVYADLRRRVGSCELLFADRWCAHRRPSMPRRHRGHVALVEVRGAIASGRSRRGPVGRQVGSDTVSGALRAAAADADARAVLLHVDSPGGSAVASESIWREVVRVRESGKPVVVSMGAAAASGGYYVACPADVIVALPATLTGSIGVFGGKFVVDEVLDQLGVTSGSVTHGSRALMYSARRGFSEPERDRLAAMIDAVYADFVGKVAAGRHGRVDEIEPLARGRVWTGKDAMERGLVDELGGLRDALRIARERAGLRDTAPLVRAARVSPLARLSRPRNSEDPRAAQATTTPDLAAVLGALGVPEHLTLRMPTLRIR